MKNKITIKIIIACIAVLVVALAVIMIIYFSTDLLKPANQLFQKYIARDINNIEDTIDISSNIEYLNFLKEKNYIDNTTINLEYLNSMNNPEKFIISVNGSTDNQNNNSYRKINIKYGENVNVSDFEFLQEDQIYGLLFASVVKQFAVVDMSDKGTALDTLHIDQNKLNNFISKYKIKDIISLIKDKREKTKNTLISYFNELDKKQFTAQKNRLITLSNGQSVTTKAFTMKMNSEQTKRLVRDILKEIGDSETINEIYSKEENFPQLIVTLYTQESNTIRIDINFGQSIKLDLYNNSIDLSYNNEAQTEEEQKTINITFKKENSGKTINYIDNKNNKISLQIIHNQEETTNNSNINISFQNSNIKGLKILMQQQLAQTDNIQIPKNFEDVRKVVLTRLDTKGVNVAISTLFQKTNNVLSIIQNMNVHSELINFWIKANEQLSEKYVTIQDNRENRFNNQFLLYRGQNVEKDIVYNLIDIASRNILNYEYLDDSNEIKIYLKEGNVDEDKAINLKKIVDKSQGNYNISFEYDNNGKITVILLEKYIKNN